MENPRNFLKAVGVMTWIHNIGRDLKVWDNLSEVKDAFLEIRMMEIATTELKKLQNFYVRSYSPSIFI